MLPLFALTLFVGAGLLFMVQPMAAKLILPLLGGTPSVWNGCMVFFQAALLGGYLIAHLSSRVRPRAQATFYLAALALPIAASLIFGRLIVAAPAADPPIEGTPVYWLLLCLGAMVGLPFLVMSAAAPMLQRWFASTDHPAAKDPYFLYAASNAGSLIGLLGYPLLVEPWLSLTDQRRAWSIAFGVFAALVGACAIARGRRPAPPSPAAAAPLPPEPHPWRTRLLWLGLSAVPSSLLLGVTQHISTDVAAVPLLWVVPLAIYLITFIIAFSSRPIPVAMISVVLPVLVLGLAVIALITARTPAYVIILLHLLGLFFLALLCHTRLAQSRPHAGRLTEFYLILALGGALGSLFNTLVAPVAFSSVIEYPLAITLALFARTPRDAEPRPWTPQRIAVTAAVPLAVGLLLFALSTSRIRAELASIGLGGEGPHRLLWLGIPAVLAYIVSRSTVSFALCIGAMFGVATYLVRHTEGNLHQSRTFFGVYRVSQDPTHTRLVHSTTAHGMQFRDPARRAEPLGYYHREGPVGDIFAKWNGTPLFDRLGLVGLGAGTIAAYGRPGQEMIFHEIDPEVVRIAQDKAFFTYIADSRARVGFVMGDGRLTISKMPDAHYGLILLDAFSSDAIPVHLITREAVALYLTKLRPGGLLAFHISNHFIELQPILHRIASELGLTMLARVHDEAPGREMEAYLQGIYGSEWAVLARSPADLAPLASDRRWLPFVQKPGEAPPALWTDDYSNILGVFHWK